ncbi:MAG: hypothetical protein AAF713_09070 [Pseudomonadota bacterium]
MTSKNEMESRETADAKDGTAVDTPDAARRAALAKMGAIAAVAPAVAILLKPSSGRAAPAPSEETFTFRGWR